MAGEVTSRRLVLFFSANTSLKLWDEVGLLAREVALYRKLAECGWQIAFVTYGGPEDLAYAPQLPGIRILCNCWRLPSGWYRRLLPWLHAPSLIRASLVKSNQVSGADQALRAARQWKKPFLARCGYLQSEFVARDHGADSAAALASLRLEATVFGAAARIVVTTADMAEDIAGRVEGARERLAVIPNYVDTESFRPMPDAPSTGEVLFIGRLVAQKNIAALLEAAETSGWRLTIIGDGPLRSLVEQAQTRLGERLVWQERVAHPELPALLAGHRLFVLPSLWEGHPKTLIEAMACGRPVLAADAPGIRGSLRHDETGWLCAPDALSLGAAASHLLAQPALCERLGRAARTEAVARFSLARVVEDELTLLNSIAAGRSCVKTFGSV